MDHFLLVVGKNYNTSYYHEVLLKENLEIYPNVYLKRANVEQRWLIGETFKFWDIEQDSRYNPFLVINLTDEVISKYYATALKLSKLDALILMYGEFSQKYSHFNLSPNIKLFIEFYFKDSLGISANIEKTKKYCSDSYPEINPQSRFNLIDGAVFNHQFNDKTFKLPKETPQDRLEILKLLETLDFISNEFEFIRLSVYDYINLNVVPEISHLKIIGIFAIIEGLLTNNSYTKTNNSINYQLQTKISLVNNRLPKKIDFGKWFNRSTSESKVIEILYTFRSDIAHGNAFDFSTGKLQELKSKENAYNFLTFLVKELIIQALREPQLFKDLKNC